MLDVVIANPNKHQIKKVRKDILLSDLFLFIYSLKNLAYQNFLRLLALNIVH
jgi:hypothetical protein